MHYELWTSLIYLAVQLIVFPFKKKKKNGLLQKDDLK
jgi:hypothetical protein